MKKIAALCIGGMLLLSLSACGSNFKQEPANTDSDPIEQTTFAAETPGTEETDSEADSSLIHKFHIRVAGSDGQNIVFRLNDSPAANALYEQLPLFVQVENYSNNEKIFYPPNNLNTDDTPLAEGPPGTLAYYAPWGNVVLFYGECGGAGGLYELGEAVSGAEQIETLSGEIQIDKVSGE